MISKIFGNKIVRILSLLLTCCIISVSLFSYSEYDNSFNTISNQETSNELGIFGAYLSDLLIQYLGYSSWLLVISMFFLCISEIRNSESVNLKIRISSSLAASIFISILISYFIQDLALNIHKDLVAYIKKLPNEYRIGVIIIASLIGVSLFFYSLGIRLEDIKILFLKILSYRKKNILSSKSSNRIPPSIREYSSRNNLTNSFSKQKDSHDILDEEDIEEDVKSYSKKQEDGYFNLPNLDLISNIKDSTGSKKSDEELSKQAEDLLIVLKDFGVKGNIIDINQGPVVTLYEFEPAAGTKSSRVISLSDDIARSLSAISARISTIPGRNALGIELPNDKREFFRIRGLLESTNYKDPNIQLPIILGKDISGKACVVDLAKMPHLLVAGTTGSGKSVAINTMIVSLLYRHTPKQCRFIMIDPKMLELSVYDGIPHLLAPVVTEPGKAVVALKWAVREMENRYRLMSNVGVRNINGYNARIAEALANGEELKRTVQTGFDVDTGKPIFESVPIEMETLPFIVIIVDEMADLMLVAGKDIESSIQRLAQMARAAGIHLIMATQRPSVDVITGVIKANFPSRISFKVTSKIDSRTILGEQGAEQLLGMGDMLYMGTSSRILRVHGPFVDDSEVERISKFLKDQGMPDYVQAVTSADEDFNPLDEAAIDSDDMSDDGLYKQALQIVKRERKSSTSYIQRSLRIGYNRAAILVERMEKEGVLSPPNHSGKREILIDEE